MKHDLIATDPICRFAGIDLAEDNISDATAILAFRHCVEQIFQTVERHLEEKGLLLWEGTVVDATIIHAHTSTKNEEKKREQEPGMHQTCKGNQWFFGMRVPGHHG